VFPLGDGDGVALDDDEGDGGGGGGGDGTDRTTLALSACAVSVLLVQARTRMLFCVDSVQVKLTVSAEAEAVHLVDKPEVDAETEFQTVAAPLYETVFAEPAVAEPAATTATTGPLVAPIAAFELPLPAFTSTAVGVGYAYTAHRTFSVSLLVNVMSRMVPPRSGAADAG